MASEIKLQALKENVESVEVNAVKVAVGDVVAKEQTLLEVQADKSALEVPSPVAGKVTELRARVGDTIKIGQVYILIEAGTNGAAAAAPERKVEHAAVQQVEQTREPEAVAQRAPAAEAAASAGTPRTPVAPAVSAAPVADKVVPAGPATRRLARELGIDLALVPGSGSHGRVNEVDVKNYVRALARGEAGAPAVSTNNAVAIPPLPRFEQWGTIERQPLSAIRRATARQMSLSWSQVPAVTQHDVCDITDLEAFRKEQATRGVKLTVTAFALKACAIALKKFPEVNSSLDLGNSQLVLKRYIHIGVAVDTPNGLLVPVLRDVDKKSVQQLGDELVATAARARDRKIDGSELSGGTFTITNLGGIGGTAFTPIVNYPEVAILGMSRSRLEPVIRDGQVVPRLMLPLSLSYDHRVIDGAAAARFTRFIAELLESPLVMLLHA